MGLNNINSKSTWGQAASDINTNFTTIDSDLKKVKNATTRNKGYFSSIDELKAAFSTANVGDIAYVGSAYPYQTWAWDGSAWKKKNDAGGEESVNLGDYYTKEETNEKLAETDEKLSELGSEVDKNKWTNVWVGQGDVSTTHYFNLIEGHTYRVTILNANWGKIQVSENSTIFSISHRVDGVISYDKRLYNGSQVDREYEIEAKISDSNNLYAITIKADVGEEVPIVLSDITETEKFNSALSTLSSEVNSNKWTNTWKGQADVSTTHYFNLVDGHTYKIRILNAFWKQDQLSSSATLFAVSHRENGTLVYNCRVNKEVGNVESEYYVKATVCDDNNKYGITIKADIGEEVVIVLEDVSDKVNESFYRGGSTSKMISPSKVYLDTINLFSKGNKIESIEVNETFELNVGGTNKLLALTKDKKVLLKNTDELSYDDAILLYYYGYFNSVVGGELYDFFNAIKTNIYDNILTPTNIEEDISSKFVFKDGLATSQGGYLFNSSVWAANEEYVDISPYNSITIRIPIASAVAAGENPYIVIYNDRYEVVYRKRVEVKEGVRSYNDISIKVEQNYKYIRTFYWNTNYKNQYSIDDFKCFASGSKSEKIEEIEKRISELHSEVKSIDTGKGIDFTYIDNATCISSTIRYGFRIELNEPYRIYSANIYNSDGTLNSDNFLHPTDGHDFAYKDWTNRKSYGIVNLENTYVRLIIAKNNKSNIERLDDIIKTFSYLDDIPVVQLNSVGKELAIKRAKQMVNVEWIPKGKIPSDNHYIGENTSKYYLSGQKQFGLPYSSVKEFDGFVPYNVSFRTFLSAINNPKSVMYTEDTLASRSRSRYGNVYHGTNCSCYYGAVCNSLVNYTLGLENNYNSNEYLTVDGMKEVEADGYTVQPLDLIWYQGHISIVTDIFVNRYGLRKFVTWTEMNIPCGRSNPYTPEEFNERMVRKGAKIYRWDKIGENENFIYSSYVQTDDDEYPIGHTYNDDLCPYLGDDCKIPFGDKVFINVLAKDYYSLILYRNDEVIRTIELNGFTKDVDGCPITDGYAGIDITQYCDKAGTYHASILKTDGKYSDKCTFHLVDISLSYDNKRISFASEGEPILIQLQGAEGGILGRKTLASTDIDNGYIDVSWDIPSGFYLKIYVRYMDVVVVKKIFV